MLKQEKQLKTFYQLAILAVAVLAIFYPALFSPANSVDDQRMLHGLLNAPHLRLSDIFLDCGSGNYYRPLLVATFWADLHLWLLEESFMHLENVLLHLANTLFLFFFAKEFLRTFSDQKPSYFPLAAALIFALHPVNTEAVNWISGRTDLLATTFFLPAIWLLWRSLRIQMPGLAWLGAGFYLLSFLCKETAIFFFPAGMIWCLLPWSGAAITSIRAGVRRVVSYYSAWVLVVVLYFAARDLAKTVDKGTNQVAEVLGGINYDLFDIFRIVFKSAGFYAKKLFVPWPLNFSITGASNVYVIFGLLILVCACWWLYRRSFVSGLYLAVGFLGCSAMLVPLLNMTWSPLAERYLYMLSGPFVVAALWSFQGLIASASTRRIAILCILGIFSVSTLQRNIIWMDNLSLFEDTDRKSPNFPPVRNELALALLNHGRIQEGLKIFAENPSLKGEGTYKKENQALSLWQEGRYSEAEALFMQAADEDPRKAAVILKTYMKLLVQKSVELDDIGQRRVLNEKIILLQGLLFDRTGDPFWLYRLGKRLMNNGDKEQALKALTKAYDLAPESVFYKEPAAKTIANLKRQLQ